MESKLYPVCLASASTNIPHTSALLHQIIYHPQLHHTLSLPNLVEAVLSDWSVLFPSFPVNSSSVFKKSVQMSPLPGNFLSVYSLPSHIHAPNATQAPHLCACRMVFLGNITDIWWHQCLLHSKHVGDVQWKFTKWTFHLKEKTRVFLLKMLWRGLLGRYLLTILAFLGTPGHGDSMSD